MEKGEKIDVLCAQLSCNTMIYMYSKFMPSEVVIFAQLLRCLPKGLSIGRMSWAERPPSSRECIVNICYPSPPTHGAVEAVTMG
jgi:hypothetical protein